jgi:hypothetical protein
MYIQCSCCRVCHDNQDGRSNCELREEWNNKTFANANKEYKRRIHANLLINNAFARPTSYEGGRHWRCSLCNRLDRK